MAVLLRCCLCPPSPPKPPKLCHCLPSHFRSGLFSQDMSHMTPCRREKVAMLYSRKPISVQVPSGTDKVSSISRSISSDTGIFQMVNFEERQNTVMKLSGFLSAIVEHVFDHQRMKLATLAQTLIFANALMVLLPIEALAETCQTDNSIFNMPILFGISLIGATVGGLLARQRKGELKRLNDQLRQINAALQRQAKIESYAPELSYAPVGRVPETEVVVDPRKQQLITNLRSGKRFLRGHDPEKAFMEFKAALELAQNLGDHIEEKKAARGLGASLQRQGKYKEAIKYHSRVLKIAKQSGEDSGTTEAYGAIADCYTELGDLEQAGKFYDKYIEKLESD